MTHRYTSVSNTTYILYPLGFMSRCRFEKEPMSVPANGQVYTAS